MPLTVCYHRSCHPWYEVFYKMLNDFAQLKHASPDVDDGYDGGSGDDEEEEGDEGHGGGDDDEDDDDDDEEEEEEEEERIHGNIWKNKKRKSNISYNLKKSNNNNNSGRKSTNRNFNNNNNNKNNSLLHSWLDSLITLSQFFPNNKLSNLPHTRVRICLQWLKRPHFHNVLGNNMDWNDY